MKKAGITLLASFALLWASALPVHADWYDSEHNLIDRGKQLYQTGQWDAALLPLNDAIAANAQSAEAHYWRALVYNVMHEPEKALSDFDRAIEIDPHQPDFYVGRGMIHSNNKDYDKALLDFDQALRINPDSSAASTNRQFVVQAVEQAKKVAEEEALKAKQPPADEPPEELAALPTAANSPNTEAGQSRRRQRADAARLAQEKLAAEKRASEEQAELERLSGEKQAEFQRFTAEKEASEKAFKDQIEHERAEKERIAKELAEAKLLAFQSNRISHPVSSNPTGPNRPVADKWALVVGISKFDDPKLNLRYPSKDARDFYDYLITQGHFQKDHVKILTDEEATRKNILSELGDKWLPRRAAPDDLVVLYISSHGSSSDLDVGGINYLLAYDSDVDNLYATGIAMQDLTRIIKGRVHSDRVVIVLDACHSGAASPDSKGLVRANVDAKDVMQGTGQLVISSSQPNQVSWEAKAEPNSVFTKYLIDGLRQKGENTRLGDAFQFMKERVQQQVLKERGVLQTPVLMSKWEGLDLLIAAPPSSPRASD